MATYQKTEKKKDKFLLTYHILKLNQEEIEKLNRTITSKVIESIKISQQRKGQDQMVSLVKFTKYLKKNKYQSFTNSSKKIEEDKIFPNSFYEIRITLTTKPVKDTARQLQTNIS